MSWHYEVDPDLGEIPAQLYNVLKVRCLVYRAQNKVVKDFSKTHYYFK